MKTFRVFLFGMIALTFIACNSGGNDANAGPSAPIGVTATAGEGRVNLSWDAVSDATSYNIYWSNTTGVSKTNGKKITGAASPYSHTGLTNGTLYCYIVTAVNSRGEGEGSIQASATPLKTEIVVMSNGFDPLIATCNTPGGGYIEYYGQRDAGGIPLNIDQIIVINNGNATNYQFDNAGYPIRMTSQDGTRFEFEWTSSQNAVLTVSTSDGQHQVNMKIDTTRSASNQATVDSGHSIRTNKSVNLEYHDRGDETMEYASTRNENSGNCIVTVTRCGIPADSQDLSVLVLDKSHRALGRFPTYRTSKGRYYTNIPTGLAPSFTLGEKCAALVDAFEKVAQFIAANPALPAVLCSYVSIAVASTAVLAPWAVQIGAACLAASEGLDVYANTLGAGPESILGKICEAKILDRPITEDFVLIAVHRGMPTNTYSQPLTVTQDHQYGPFNLDVNLGTETSIDILTLDPGSPGAMHDYIASSDLTCLTAGTNVIMSVSGTDGYTNSASQWITTAQEEGTYTLTVPGAESGVEDTITVKVVLPSGKVLTRDVSIRMTPQASALAGSWSGTWSLTIPVPGTPCTFHHGGRMDATFEVTGSNVTGFATLAGVQSLGAYCEELGRETVTTPLSGTIAGETVNGDLGGLPFTGTFKNGTFSGTLSFSWEGYSGSGVFSLTRARRSSVPNRLVVPIFAPYLLRFKGAD